MIQSFIYGLVFAGFVMLFDFLMWEGNPLSFYYDYLETIESSIKKPLGLCKICFTFWVGSIFYTLIYFFDFKYYLIFIGAAELIIIFYHILILNIKK